MGKYCIMFDNGDISMLVAQDVTLEEANEIVSQQLDPFCYKITPEKPAGEDPAIPLSGNAGREEKALTEKNILRYLGLVDRRLKILLSGVNWKPEYEDELLQIDKELTKLRILVDEEHRRRAQAAG